MLKKLCYLAPLLFLSIANPAFSKKLRDPVEIPPSALKSIGGIDGLIAKFKSHAKQEGIGDDYPDAVLKEVDEFLKSPLSFDGLHDAKHLPFVTIDNPYSKDLDQAIFVGATDTGGYVLYYAIADTAYFVKPDSALNAWAEKRMLTTYMPFVDIPILPRALSEDLCSLSPEKERRAVMAAITFDSEGRIQEATFERVVIKSRAQLTYGHVQKFYDEPETSPLHGQEYSQGLDNMRRLGELLIAGAAKRGVIPFPESDLRFEKRDETYWVGFYERYHSELINEQMSIATNRAVAQHLRKHGKQALNRYHPSPKPHQYKDLRRKAKDLGRPIPKYKKHGNGSHLADYMRERLASDLLVDRAAQNLVVHLNFKASYDAHHSGHSGLRLTEAEADYVHFTAPMRRHPDTIIHRILLGEGEPSVGELERFAKAANEAGERTKRIERKNNELLLALVLSERTATALPGAIDYLGTRGVQVKLDGYPFTLWLNRKQLATFGYKLNGDGLSYASEQGDRLAMANTMELRVQLDDDYRLKVEPVVKAPLAHKHKTSGARRAGK